MRFGSEELNDAFSYLSGDGIFESLLLVLGRELNDSFGVKLFDCYKGFSFSGDFF